MAAQLSILSDTELLQRFWVERDPLTTTDLETLMAERFGAYIDAMSGYADVIAVLDDLDGDYDAKSLRDQLDRLKKFDQAMEDLLEPLQTLTTLATTE